MTEPVRNQAPTTPRSGLAVLEQMASTIRASEEAKRELASQLQRYGEAFSKLKAAYEQLTAAHDILKDENATLKQDKANLIQINRRQASDIQAYESQFQMFSAEVVSSDAQLLDYNNMVAGIFGLEEPDSSQSLSTEFSLEQTINAYSVDPLTKTIQAPVTALPALSSEEGNYEGQQDLITDADFNLDFEAIARDIEEDADKAA